MPAISAMVLGEEEQFADLSASESEDEMMEGEELIDFDLEARKYLVNPDDDYDDYYDDHRNIMKEVKATVQSSDLKISGSGGSKVEKSITGAGNVTMKAMQQKYRRG